MSYNLEDAEHEIKQLKTLLKEAIELLEHSNPPEGGRTEAFIQKAKRIADEGGSRDA